MAATKYLMKTTKTKGFVWVPSSRAIINHGQDSMAAGACWSYASTSEAEGGAQLPFSSLLRLGPQPIGWDYSHSGGLFLPQLSKSRQFPTDIPQKVT